MSQESKLSGTSLVVQWLGLAPDTENLGLNNGLYTQSHSYSSSHVWM